MHLTNYAINKESENFVQNTDKNNDYVGSKRSIQSVYDNISETDGSEVYRKIKLGIYDIVIKSMCLSTPHVTHLIRSCHPDYDENQLCFQILGFDVMIDNGLKPYLLEINQMPSFGTDSPLVAVIKRGLLQDCLKTLCLNV